MKSKVCGHAFEHEGWPEDELCPDCFFAALDTDEAYYRAEAICEETGQWLGWKHAIAHAAAHNKQLDAPAVSG